METKEIMTTNEEVMEVTEDIVNAGSGNAGKVIAGLAGAIVVGGLIYKFIAKPLIAKHKAKKNAITKGEVIECDDFEDCETEEEIE